MFFNLFKSESKNAKDIKSDQARRRRSHAQNKRQKLEMIPVDHLRIGMYVRELDKPWEESSFMFQGLDVKTQQDILAVQKECRYVWVDYSEYTLAPNKKISKPSALDNSTTSLLSDGADAGLQKMHTLAQETVQNMFDDIRLGGQIDAGKVKNAVNDTVDSILRNPDAAIWLTRLQAKDKHTAQHSLNVTALSIVLGRDMGMSGKEMEDLGVCAMLHDVGKTSLPTELLNKEGPLSKDELVLMHKHPKFGRDVLVSTQSVFSGAADVAYCHHERPDGTGYPRGLSADEIPMYAQIVSIAEAYDTITTNQTYCEARSPSEALHILYAERGKQFDDELVIKFIDSIGIFPPGSVVEMSNGEVGIVLSNTRDKLKPKVIILLDKNKDATPQRVVDLTHMTLNSDGAPYLIKTSLRDGEYGIVVEDFIKAGLRIG
jgi:HD-GYP domain-containing protein (c-di-GMP phosphodiesterase class II)